MKIIAYLILFFALPVAALSQSREGNFGINDSSKFYIRNNLMLGGYSNQYSRGVELGYGLSFGYKSFFVGGFVKGLKSIRTFQKQATVLLGVRLPVETCKMYLSVGPGQHTEQVLKSIYYMPHYKVIDTYKEDATTKGFFIHLEVIKPFGESGEGIGAYGTVFIGNGILATGIGVNFMFGTRQN